MDTNFKLYDTQQIFNGLETFALIAAVLLLAYYFFIRRPIAGKKVATAVVAIAVVWSLCHAGAYYISARQYLDYRKQATSSQQGGI